MASNAFFFAIMVLWCVDAPVLACITPVEDPDKLITGECCKPRRDKAYSVTHSFINLLIGVHKQENSSKH